LVREEEGMNIKEAPRSWKVGALVVMGIVIILIAMSAWAWLGWSRASEASRQAELERESAVARMEQITLQAEQAIAEANERAQVALKKVGEAQARERAAIDRARSILEQRQDDLARVPRLSDTSLTVAAADDLLAAYPSTQGAEIAFNGTGFTLTRPAMEAAVKSWRETVSLRHEIIEVRTANSELRDQVAELMNVVQAGDDKTAALETRIVSLEEAMRAEIALRKAREAELAAERRRYKVRVWRDRAISIGMLAGGIALGSLIK
jgi:myosin heavy subunit